MQEMSSSKKRGLVVALWGKAAWNEAGCCEWLSGKNRDGYGFFYHNNGVYMAHRIMYELWYGLLDEGLVVMHTCDNPACINPMHLRAGTQADNIMDCKEKGRLNRARGDRSGRAKIGDAGAKTVLLLASLGKLETAEDYRTVARFFGATERAIRKIVRRESYRHISI